jgi:RNA polymerase sigma-70 factor (ECF subfamily)
MLDDREVRRLLLATAARDAAGFEALYRKAAPLLLAIALRIVVRRELAEEVLHDAFVKIWNSAERFDPTVPNPVAWMVAIVRNRAIDLISSANVARVVSADGDNHGALEEAHSVLDEALGAGVSSEEAFESDRRTAQVRDCLAELKAPERQALVLAYYHGLSHGELARRMDKPLGTVKGWVRRAMENLRLCVERCMGEAREAGRAS